MSTSPKTCKTTVDGDLLAHEILPDSKACYAIRRSKSILSLIRYVLDDRPTQLNKCNLLNLHFTLRAIIESLTDGYDETKFSLLNSERKMIRGLQKLKHEDAKLLFLVDAEKKHDDWSPEELFQLSSFIAANKLS